MLIEANLNYPMTVLEGGGVTLHAGLTVHYEILAFVHMSLTTLIPNWFSTQIPDLTLILAKIFSTGNP